MTNKAAQQHSTHPRPPAMDEVSWGTAFFGFPAAPGLRVLSDQAPAPWLRALVTQHTDAHGLVSLFRTCKAGTQLVLNEAPSVQLRREKRERRSQWLVDALSMRCSPQRTVLDIGDAYSKEDRQAVWELVERLGNAAGQAVTGLTATRMDPVAAVKFLGYAASVFPNLTTLSASGCVLPTPAQLPRLTALKTECPVPAALHSHTQLLPQITTLQYSYMRDETWAQLLPSPETYALKHFSTLGDLSDELASILVKCPALTHVRVGDVRLSEQSRQLEWGVRVLAFDVSGYEPGVYGLSCLPACRKDARETQADLGTREMPPVSEMDRKQWLVSAMSPKNFEPIWERLPDCIWLFKRNQVADLQREWRALDRAHAGRPMRDEAILLCPPCGNIMSTPTLTHQEPNTLCSVLEQLAAAGCDHGVSLTGLPWSAEQLMHGLDETLPTVTVRVDGALKDGALGFLVQAGKHVSKLSADSVALQSDTHANTPWPWDDFSVAHFDISALLKLPDPGGGDGLRVIRCAELSLGGVTTETDTQALQERLKHVRFEPLKASGDITICLRSEASESQQHSNLQAQADLVQHITLHTHDKYNLAYYGAVTPETVKVLSALQPTGYLDLHDATWPCSGRAYVQLAQQLPLSFTGWLAFHGRVLRDAYEERRRVSGLPPLTLYYRRLYAHDRAGKMPE